MHYWANTCKACSALQGDWFLREPDGPFFPQTPSDERALSLAWVDLPIEAEAGFMEAWWLDKFVARHA